MGKFKKDIINFVKMRREGVLNKGSTPIDENSFGKVGGYLNLEDCEGYLPGSSDARKLEGFISSRCKDQTVASLTMRRLKSGTLKVHSFRRSTSITTYKELSDTMFLIAGNSTNIIERHVALEFENHAVGLSLIKVNKRLTVVYSDLGGFEYNLNAQLFKLSDRVKGLFVAPKHELAGLKDMVSSLIKSGVKFGFAYTFDVTTHQSDAEKILKEAFYVCGELHRMAKYRNLNSEQILFAQQDHMKKILKELGGYRDIGISLRLTDDLQRSGCCAYQNMNSILKLHLAYQYLCSQAGGTEAGSRSLGSGAAAQSETEQTNQLVEALVEVEKVYEDIRKQEMLEALCNIIRWTKKTPETSASGGVKIDVLEKVVKQLLDKWDSSNSLLLDIYEEDPTAFHSLSCMVMENEKTTGISWPEVHRAKIEIFKLSFKKFLPDEMNRKELKVEQFHNCEYFIRNADSIIDAILNSPTWDMIDIREQVNKVAKYDSHFPVEYGGTEENDSLAIIRSAYEIEILFRPQNKSNASDLQLALMVILSARAFKIEKKPEGDRTLKQQEHLKQLRATLTKLRANIYNDEALVLEIREAYNYGHTGKFTAPISMLLGSLLKRGSLGSSPCTKTIITNVFQICDKADLIKNLSVSHMGAVSRKLR